MAESHKVIEYENNLFSFILSSTHISEVQSGRKLHTTAAQLRVAPYMEINTDIR